MTPEVVLLLLHVFYMHTSHHTHMHTYTINRSKILKAISCHQWSNSNVDSAHTTVKTPVLHTHLGLNLLPQSLDLSRNAKFSK